MQYRPQATNEMSSTVIEYINGIEILKAEEQVHSDAPVTFDDHSIEGKNVSFGYHEDKEILHGVDLTIPQSSMTALVGPSGSGKFTLAKLIAGFWDVKSGSITMGGHNLKDIPLSQLYDQVAFVSQDNYLFDDTVRENIRMGRINATDDEVEATAHAAGCDSFIGGLEHGYDTMVGGGGAHLSGGEKQRISIARAIQKDAPSSFWTRPRPTWIRRMRIDCKRLSRR